MTLAERFRFARMARQARRTPIEDKVQAALAARDRADAAEIAAQAVLPPDTELVDYCRLAATTARAPLAFFSVVTAERQIIKAGHGLSGAIDVGAQMPLRFAVCALVAAHNEPLVVDDTRHAPELEHCTVLGGLRAYNGAPVHLGGQPIGALAVASTTPRIWTDEERDAVARIAVLVTLRVAALTHRL